MELDGLSSTAMPPSARPCCDCDLWPFDPKT